MAYGLQYLMFKLLLKLSLFKVIEFVSFTKRNDKLIGNFIHE